MLKGGKPGVLQSTGSQSDTTEQLNQHKAGKNQHRAEQVHAEGTTGPGLGTMSSPCVPTRSFPGALTNRKYRPCSHHIQLQLQDNQDTDKFCFLLKLIICSKEPQTRRLRVDTLQ